MKAKVVIYARVSSKEQEREGYSIPAQLKLLREYAKKNNQTIAAEFVEAETAKKTGRKQYRKMLDFLEDNPDVKDILVEKVDRMYRNFHDSVALDIDSRHLRLHFVKSGKILSKESKSQDVLHHNIDLALSSYYVKNLSEEVIKGSDEKAAQGGWPGPAPLGYKNRLEDKTIIIHPQESVLIRKAFEMAATGQYSLQSLSDELYTMGLRSKRAKSRVSKSAMSRVLNNPFYYGYFLRKGKLYPATHESIITKQLFDVVQGKMGHVKKPAATKLQLAYMGTMTCSHCGCAITGELKKKRYVYYRCTNGKRICNNVKYLKEEMIEENFKQVLQQIRIPTEVIEWTRTALLDASKIEQTDREAQISILNQRYKELDRKISKSYDHFIDGGVDQDTWKRKNDEWKQEKVEIQQQLDTLELDNDAFMKEGIRLMELASNASKLFDYMNSDEKRELVNLVLSNPQIKDGSLCYDYKKPFSMFVNVTNLENWRRERDSNPRPSA